MSPFHYRSTTFRIPLSSLSQPELEIPKLLWLKNHMDPSVFSNCQFFALADYLSYRATGDPTRSSSSLTCKCSFISQVGWKDKFFAAITLTEFCETGYKQIGAEGSDGEKMVGMPVGKGLESRAAEELGLVEGTPVGSALVDLYVCFCFKRIPSFG
jgi:ribulose kinase